ncbi:aminoglycoside phosphotransferase family protein [Streptomyces sp. NBC_01381]|uniref:aminoglycoside phosphotransferase family protein n=1 Tax=Streptomyces sp. NBC_01381 TaxID=2903845 RepID=UPI00225BE3C3|nr:aminoglycoside phosphotransferase family protein [Streptomyces sp. NBC_01381]MCX4672925.1 aminoglycoside phosphotransferase family protein [Streptomyces sp. NBC_01381]
MSEYAVEVQPVVRRKAMSLGGFGEAWLRRLPGLVEDLARRWSISVGPPLAGGTSSYVAHARTHDGRDAVLKLALPEGDFASQVRTLRLAEGQGYAELLAHDVECHAMLLEALGPPMDRLGLPPRQQMETLCALLRRAWRVPRAEGLTVDPALEKARALGELVGRLWESLGRPCSERVVARALEFAERKAAAFDPDRCVVVHGDPHAGNALRTLAPRAGSEQGFVFVDPDGSLADPAYDLGVVLRDWCPELLAGDAAALARSYCALLAARSGVAATAIWEWGFLERVSTGLYVLDFGAEELGRPYLDTAELLA